MNTAARFEHMEQRDDAARYRELGDAGLRGNLRRALKESTHNGNKTTIRAFMLEFDLGQDATGSEQYDDKRSSSPTMFERRDSHA